MPSCAKRFKLGLVLCLLLGPLPSLADSFGAKIHYAKLLETEDAYLVSTEIDYQLSPTAWEALHKGVPLTWTVVIKLLQPGFLRDVTVFKQKLLYALQFHALLNQYEVTPPQGQPEMFLSLNAAMNFMASLPDAAKIDKQLLKSGRSYQLAVKTHFNRESLPVPLRPVAYLDPQWFLSSDWYIWPIQK